MGLPQGHVGAENADDLGEPFAAAGAVKRGQHVADAQVQTAGQFRADCQLVSPGTGDRQAPIDTRDRLGNAAGRHADEDGVNPLAAQAHRSDDARDHVAHALDLAYRAGGGDRHRHVPAEPAAGDVQVGAAADRLVGIGLDAARQAQAAQVRHQHGHDTGHGGNAAQRVLHDRGRAGGGDADEGTHGRGHSARVAPAGGSGG